MKTISSTDTAPATGRLYWRGLDQLADGSHLPALVQLLTEAGDDAARAEVQSVFESLADRIPAGQHLDVSALARALNTTNEPTRIALLQVAALFADEQLRSAFRRALKDASEPVRTGAARALCNSRDVGLMPELLELARSASDPALRARIPRTLACLRR